MHDAVITEEEDHCDEILQDHEDLHDVEMDAMVDHCDEVGLEMEDPDDADFVGEWDHHDVVLFVEAHLDVRDLEMDRYDGEDFVEVPHEEVLGEIQYAEVDPEVDHSSYAHLVDQGLGEVGQLAFRGANDWDSLVTNGLD